MDDNGREDTIILVLKYTFISRLYTSGEQFDTGCFTFTSGLEGDRRAVSMVQQPSLVVRLQHIALRSPWPCLSSESFRSSYFLSDMSRSRMMKGRTELFISGPKSTHGELVLRKHESYFLCTPSNT